MERETTIETVEEWEQVQGKIEDILNSGRCNSRSDDLLFLCDLVLEFAEKQYPFSKYPSWYMPDDEIRIRFFEKEMRIFRAREDHFGAAQICLLVCELRKALHQ